MKKRPPPAPPSPGLFDAPEQEAATPLAAAPSPRVYRVAELADTLRGLLEGALPSVWVQGELSNFRNPAGHWYFTLKDAQAQIQCVMFKGRNYLVRPVPRDGDAVLLRGQVSFYGAQGKAQVVAQHLEPAGEGALLRAFEELKKKLAAEGLFDESAKRPIPAAPRGIGIITSPTGAALQDMLTTLRRRYPLGQVYVYPVPVQGDAAAGAIVRALADLPVRAPVDVILLARGGGSLEDLWCFNDERMARAIRACRVPVVTGVGHETDTTIADFAADLRAPTPTGAAERASPDLAEWSERVTLLGQALIELQHDGLRMATDTLARLRTRLDLVHPGRRIQQSVQRLDELGERLAHVAPAMLVRRHQQLHGLQARLRSAHPARQIQLQRMRIHTATQKMQSQLRARLQDLQHRLRTQANVLASLGPQAVLDRGYAIAQSADGSVVRDAAALREGQALKLTLARGKVDTRVVK